MLGVGDTIGCFLILPPSASLPTTTQVDDSTSHADLLLPAPVKKGKKKKPVVVVEEKKEESPSIPKPTITDSDLTLLNGKRNLFIIGSKMLFFKNGINQGVSFSDLYAGIYYPSVSLYMGANVTANFGPDFKYPPPCVDEILSKEEHRHTTLIEKNMPVGVLSNSLAAYYYSLIPPRKIPIQITPTLHGIYPHHEGSGTLLSLNHRHFAAVVERRR